MSEQVNWEEGKITDEGIEYMRSFIGQKHEVRPWNTWVTPDTIWHFALGIGDDNPMWWDETYAEGTRWGKMIAPPTYLYSASSGGRYFQKENESSGGVESFLPGTLAIQASDRWKWHRPTYVGEKIRAFADLYDVQEITKSNFGGRSVAQVGRTSYVTEKDELIAESFLTTRRFERTQTRARAEQKPRERPVYSEADQRKFIEQYEGEAAQRRGSDPRYWEDVSVGDRLGPILKGPLTITNLVGWVLGWGSPLCPTNRIASQYLRKYPGARVVDDRYGIEDTIEGAHWNIYIAEKSGMGDGYDWGSQRISWAAHLLTDWCGDDGFVTDLDVQLRRPNLLGDVTWISGEVSGKREEAGTHLVDVTLAGVNQNEEQNFCGTATVQLLSRAG